MILTLDIGNKLKYKNLRIFTKLCWGQYLKRWEIHKTGTEKFWNHVQCVVRFGNLAFACIHSEQFSEGPVT